MAISISVFSAPPVQLGPASALLGKGLAGTRLGTRAGLTPCDSEVLSRFWVFLGSWPDHAALVPSPVSTQSTASISPGLGQSSQKQRGWPDICSQQDGDPFFSALCRHGAAQTLPQLLSSCAPQAAPGTVLRAAWV